MSGVAYIVGAGPGDPELLTLKAHRLLHIADVLIYDRLVDERILELVPPSAERIFAGKEASKHHLPQEEINRLLVVHAKAGRTVVRLKGGDPLIFGRGGEEALELAQHGVRFEIVPCVTSASGCGAYAGIPLTHRGLATGVRYLTGHSKGDDDLPHDWAGVADPETTLVVFMGLTHMDIITARLMEHGLPASTPLAAIQNGTTPRQRVLLSTLAHAVEDVALHAIKPPALLIIGRVVTLAKEIAWFPGERIIAR